MLRQLSEANTKLYSDKKKARAKRAFFIACFLIVSDNRETAS